MGKIYTKKGDQGQTSLFTKQRVWKDDLRVSAYGNLDELNSLLGVVRSQTLKFPDVADKVLQIQKNLMTISAQLANPHSDSENLSEEIRVLEEWIDELQKPLLPQKNFIIPGGTILASMIHLARTVCRRAERTVVTLNREEKGQLDILQYLNRLSDLLYALALYINYQDGEAEIFWTKDS